MTINPMDAANAAYNTQGAQNAEHVREEIEAPAEGPVDFEPARLGDDDQGHEESAVARRTELEDDEELED